MNKYYFETRLPTLNEYISAINKNRHKGNELKKSSTNKIKWLSISQNRKKKTLPDLYDINLGWFGTYKKTDPDNIYFAIKFILDGLVLAKILPNDGRKNIRNIYNNIEQSKKPGVLVEFINVESQQK